MKLFEPIWKTNKREKLEEALAAVREITDPGKLQEAALSAYFPEVRSAALERITDQKLLHKVILANDTDYEIRREAVRRISDPEVLTEIAMQRQAYPADGDAIAMLSDQEQLRRIALSEQGGEQDKAVYKIGDQGILGEIRDYYHAQAGGAGLEQDAAFIQEQSNQIHDLNLRTTLVLCGLFLFAVGVMLNNFLSAQRREKEDNILLSSVRQAANTDPLTGVKSKHAYVQAEESLDQRIAEKMTEGFAIAVCDVNDLKKVNDTQGHKAGDEYIRSACAMICKQYKHSPVYRIGGDEFVVILEGSDYSERHRLLAEINQQSEINQREGGPVVSVGVSDFIPEQDISVQQVFERADEVMYARKKYLKAQFPSYR